MTAQKSALRYAVSSPTAVEVPSTGFGKQPTLIATPRGLDHGVILSVLGALFLVRLLMVFWFPFTDTTEARYAEIARLMVVTNDWITPFYEPGVPFWGKPPLHTWLSAVGMKVFGVGAFGARIPIFACAIAILATLFAWVRMEAGRTTALVATLACASSALFFGASAFVMTDIPMVLGTTLSMVGFFVATTNLPGDRFWGHLFFVGLAIGMLAKGPVAVVLTVLPILLWLLLGRRWRLLGNLPWRSGLVLGLFLAAPWYIAAEVKTPGFLRYFLIGEHLERFIVPGWQGDLYGSGHERPKGTIWFFALGAFLPWTVFLLAQPSAAVKAMRKIDPSSVSYLLLWMAAPMLFFTPSANILASYVLPAVPAFSFLVAMVVVSETRSGFYLARYGFWACVTISLLCFAFATAVMRFAPELISGRTAVGPVRYIQDTSPDAAISVYPRRVYSADYYTKGWASVLSTKDTLAALSVNDRTDAVIVSNSHLDTAIHALGKGFSVRRHYPRYTVLIEMSK